MIFSGLTMVGGFTLSASGAAPGGSNFIGQLGNPSEAPLLFDGVVTGDSDGNLYLAGTYYNVSFNNSIFVAKYNNTGTIQWQRTLSGASTSNAESIAVDSSGNVYV